MNGQLLRSLQLYSPAPAHLRPRPTAIQKPAPPSTCKYLNSIKGGLTSRRSQARKSGLICKARRGTPGGPGPALSSLLTPAPCPPTPRYPLAVYLEPCHVPNHLTTPPCLSTPWSVHPLSAQDRNHMAQCARLS